ncbi:helix-turn-helix transcriptional regulator [Pradoshia sp. D12]|uniref:helix-turn-helix domain-containing protein n=1 Tax=Bacillaceae TaxID=186817 RepID=UPI00080AE41B|nr:MULTISPECIES: helix-turn-helix transcriptional regulator [Bacillaceae]OCA89885.1 transcriptional regulator [Bacillus sp. FJAT-27986]QFK70716.1 helix-turn-helix transcriptional regulator [Pradoshia sp. D12]TPF72510.1 helix-turn-helix transcriptional regulator [Bacillus sp. D12]
MIGRNIQEIRKRKGMTLTQLAANAGISKSYLSNIERGVNQNPSIEVLKRLAFVLNADLKTLLRVQEGVETNQNMNQELINLIEELKTTVIDKEQMDEYRALIEYIMWKSKVK